MAWVAVDKDSTECIYEFGPVRSKIYDGKFVPLFENSMWLTLPKGSIKKLIGRDLTWEDKPIELKEE